MAEYYAPLDKLVVELASGAIVAPGEIVELSTKEASEDANKSLIDEERLLPMEKGGGGK